MHSFLNQRQVVKKWKATYNILFVTFFLSFGTLSSDTQINFYLTAMLFRIAIDLDFYPDLVTFNAKTSILNVKRPLEMPSVLGAHQTELFWDRVILMY